MLSFEEGLGYGFVTLLIYAFIMDSLFGHPTYWRWWQALTIFSEKDSLSNLVGQPKWYKKILRKPSKEKLIEGLHDYVLMESFAYLTCYEVWNNPNLHSFIIDNTLI